MFCVLLLYDIVNTEKQSFMCCVREELSNIQQWDMDDGSAPWAEVKSNWSVGLLSNKRSKVRHSVSLAWGQWDYKGLTEFVFDWTLYRAAVLWWNDVKNDVTFWSVSRTWGLESVKIFVFALCSMGVDRMSLFFCVAFFSTVKILI